VCWSSRGRGRDEVLLRQMVRLMHRRVEFRLLMPGVRSELCSRRQHRQGWHRCITIGCGNSTIPCLNVLLRLLLQPPQISWSSRPSCSPAIRQRAGARLASSHRPLSFPDYCLTLRDDDDWCRWCRSSRRSERLGLELRLLARWSGRRRLELRGGRTAGGGRADRASERAPVGGGPTILH
jgi:hypothetical protein